VKNQACGVEVDLWALGVVLFQMLLGYTPYGAPSPYLTFLRIRRSFLQVRGAVIEY
jgi:serine/threonine protein kinase